ncbi:Mediator of RNA polymerase II transcription subunit 21 [Wickerhamiella sorbophila]|uniref:Mediator of RNA polymerase II transcription subunit 21 n=1 Tax=Wickerhamiella sorbophila TaxID=45607 RepID=A0A2T0FJU2_9ASCO|nr:Mediator of RNA polymerase II transcription subunit 21 [Wickerhamiella sorbophila]PRT55252.1 Mediator of RNA polymerase II transcription subunit 21 [Wickerhamiella sorbophila]
MSDRLSQLQTCFDQLVTQFFSSLNYINQHHEFVPADGQQPVSDTAHQALPKQQFTKDLEELAKDMAMKAKQIEVLIDSLPGIDTSEKLQMESLASLEEELLQVHQERQEAIDERRRLLGLCDDLILRITKDKVELELDENA